MTGDEKIPFANLILRRDPPWVVSSDIHNSDKGVGDGDGKKGLRNGKGKNGEKVSGEGDVKRLTLAAHYDSLYRPEGFIGAVDSAAPCAILMAVARGVDALLTRRWDEVARRREERMEELESGLVDEEETEDEEEMKGVQIVLFDGEEAWERWTSTDSTYGSRYVVTITIVARELLLSVGLTMNFWRSVLIYSSFPPTRALAEAWESSPYSASSTHSNRLESISLLVLLDLLGAPNPRIPSYFWDTHSAYGNLAKIEDRLRNLGLLETAPPAPFLPDSKKPYNRFTRGYIQDDHVPFMERGVKVLHVIPTPFPKVWHTMLDDGEHLDLPTVRDWAKIITAFVAEWMDLDGVLTEELKSCEGEEQKGGEGGTEKDEL